MTNFNAEQVSCPSGLTGLVRPILVGDISSLANSQGRKNADGLGMFLSRLWEKTVEPGLYVDGENVVPDKPISRWDRVFLGDRAFLVFESRRITWGNEFYFDHPCPKCRAKISWRIDLSELEYGGFSDEMAEAIKTQGTDAVLHRTLPKSGHRVGFKPLLGSDQVIIERAARQGEGAMGEASILCRLPEIDGCKSPGDRRAFVRGMHMADLAYLRNEWDEADLYVQDTVEIECKCGATPEIVIPTDGNFFSEESARRKRARRSRR